MDERPESVLWLVLAVPVLGMLAASLLRWVPAGHLMVVTRRGIVSRVVRPGLTVRTPATDSVLVALEPDEVPLVVRATTRDGTCVRLLASAVVRLVPPTPLERYVDPLPSAVGAIERLLALVVAEGDLHDLPVRLQRAWPDLAAQADRETRPRGVRVDALEIAELDAVLTPFQDASGPD